MRFQYYKRGKKCPHNYLSISFWIHFATIWSLLPTLWSKISKAPNVKNCHSTNYRNHVIYQEKLTTIMFFLVCWRQSCRYQVLLLQEAGTKNEVLVQPSPGDCMAHHLYLHHYVPKKDLNGNQIKWMIGNWRFFSIFFNCHGCQTFILSYFYWDLSRHILGIW